MGAEDERTIYPNISSLPYKLLSAVRAFDSNLALSPRDSKFFSTLWTLKEGMSLLFLLSSGFSLFFGLFLCFFFSLFLFFLSFAFASKEVDECDVFGSSFSYVL